MRSLVAVLLLFLILTSAFVVIFSSSSAYAQWEGGEQSESVFGQSKIAGSFTPGLYLSGDGPVGFGGTLAFVRIFKYVDFDFGAEYRGGSAKSLTVYIDSRVLPFKSRSNAEGPFISVGGGFGAAGYEKMRPAAEARGALGYNLPLGKRTGIGISGRYRFGYQFDLHKKLADHIVGIGLTFYLRER